MKELYKKQITNIILNKIVPKLLELMEELNMPILKNEFPSFELRRSGNFRHQVFQHHLSRYEWELLSEKELLNLPSDRLLLLSEKLIEEMKKREKELKKIFDIIDTKVSLSYKRILLIEKIINKNNTEIVIVDEGEEIVMGEDIEVDEEFLGYIP